MDKKSLETIFGELLVTHGFKKKASTWYRQGEGALQVVDLQKSSFGMQFYINLCCVPVGMSVEGMPTPKEHKCSIRIRLTSAFPEEKEEIEKILDLERRDIDNTMRLNQITRITNQLVIPFLALMKDVTSLKRAMEKGRLKNALIDLAAQKHLGINEAR